MHLGFARRLVAEAWLALGHINEALAGAHAAVGILAGIFRARPGRMPPNSTARQALTVLGRCEQSASDNAAAVATLGEGLAALAPYFKQRPVVLAPIMKPLIDCLVEFDAEAASRLVPVALRSAIPDTRRTRWVQDTTPLFITPLLQATGIISAAGSITARP